MTEDALDAILNFYPHSVHIGSAGQPAASQFAAIAQAGFDVVINLATPASDNALPNEAELVAAQGMAYVHIPVVWQQPTPADFERFAAALDANSVRRVFVHCALNYRASAFLYLYRMIRRGMPHEEAMWDVLAIWEPDDNWTAFMSDVLAAHGLPVPAWPWLASHEAP